MKVKRLKIWCTVGALATMISVGTVSLTTAHLYDTAYIVNLADTAEVPNEIVENFNGTEKTNVRIKNVGNIGAYIRVAVVPIWRDEDKSATTLPTENTYDMTLNTVDWFLGKDGYYYCRTVIYPDEETPDLIKRCTLKELTDRSYDGKYFDLQILAQSIQFDPVTAIESVWAVSVDDDGTLIPR